MVYLRDPQSGRCRFLTCESGESGDATPKLRWWCFTLACGHTSHIPPAHL